MTGLYLDLYHYTGNSMPKLLILADDLTGALDTGIQFAEVGINTVVSINPEKLDSDVVVLDTESRHILPQDAYRKVRDVISKIGEVEYIYKKTDSALRGNIGMEFKAIIDQTSSPIIFVPAFPEMGRTTRNGIQYIDGVPLEKSYFALDPINPTRKSYIPDIIKEQADIDCVVVTREQYENIEFKGKTCYIIDGETREDLETFGRILKDKGLINVTAGCAGFARTLTYLVDLKREGRRRNLNLKSKPLILICGSINKTSIDQIEYAKRKYQVLDIVLSPEEILNKDLKSPQIEDCDIISVRTIGKELDMERYREYAYSRGVEPKDLPFMIQDRVGEITSNLLELTQSNTLVVFGGDTLFGIAKRLGITHFFPIIEIEDGVVLSEANSLFFITKAGGFGRGDIIDTIVLFIEKYRL